MESKVLKIRHWVATVVVLVALAGGALLSQGYKNWTGHTVFGAPGAPIAITQNALPVSLGNFANGFSAVLKPALPAVVNISSSKVVKPGRNQQSPIFNDPMFRQFFGDQFGQGQGRPMREQSLGSGVIVSSDGTILTNNHVVEGATDIKVFLSDKREFQAKVIGTDPKTDIAVLKIDATRLPTLPLGDSNQLQVGDLIFAIGDPFGVGETATMGIVSATGRGGFGIENYENFIQTDAAINPGNSGGAMIDIHGNLVGINTAILSHGGNGGEGGNEGVGFAIPVSMAKPVMDQILTHGKVVRGYLGIHIQEVTPELARAFGLKQGGGVLVGDVAPNTPAANAGLKKGDVILQLNGETVDAPNQLQVQIAQFAPGTNVKLQIWRNGGTQDVSLKLAELDEHDDKQASGEATGATLLEGIQVQDLTSDIAQQLSLPAGTRGVVVSSVDPSSPAAASGLSQGDVIQEVNHKSISSTSDYQQAMAGANKQPVLLLVNNRGVTRYVVVEPQQ
ncbi:MAG: Do family serine endopeptidase [Candidatus Acidiferrales bacterium]